MLQLVLGNFGLVEWHIKLGRSSAADDGQTLFGCGLVAPIVQSAVQVLGLDVHNVLLVQHERVRSTCAYHTRTFVHLEPSTRFGTSKIRNRIVVVVEVVVIVVAVVVE